MNNREKQRELKIIAFDADEDSVTCEECGGSGLAVEGWDCEECDGLGYWQF